MKSFKNINEHGARWKVISHVVGITRAIANFVNDENNLLSTAHMMNDKK